MKHGQGIKRILMFPAVALLCFVCHGMGTPDTVGSKNQSSQTVENRLSTSHPTLTMYLIGEKSPDFDLVLGELNARLEQTVGATLTARFLAWDEYERKYPLLFASGEEFDIVYTADWAYYDSQATKGAFLEITEPMLERYAPLTHATMYPQAWEQAKVNGGVYMLPMNYTELTGYVFLVRGDLMDRYGCPPISTLEDFGGYLSTVVEHEPQLIPLDIGSDFDAYFLFERFWNRCTANELSPILPWQLQGYTGRADTERRIRHISAYQQFLECVMIMKEWKDAGYWSKSAILNKHTNKESFLLGRSAAALMNFNDATSMYTSLKTLHPDWRIQVVDAEDGAAPIRNRYIANGMAVYARSKQPELALQILDQLRNDETCHDLFCYGIKGLHYELDDEGKLVTLPATVRYPVDSNGNWGIRNDVFWKPLADDIPNHSEIADRWTREAEPRAYEGFLFNDIIVKNQVNELNDIFNSDLKRLVLGFSEDPEADIQALRKKIDERGLDEVFQEMGRQLISSGLSHGME